MSVPTVKRWAARRELCEGAEPNFARVALAFGGSADELRRRSAREGWRLRENIALDMDERIGRQINHLIGKIEEMELDKVGDFAAIDKGRIDAIMALVRALEKIIDITRGGESAKEKQIASDEEMASVLERINGRIVELAQEYAGQLVAGKLLEPRTAADLP